MRKTLVKKSFKGALSQPISRKALDDAVDRATFEAAIQILQHEMDEKIPLLIEHYSINQDLSSDVKTIMLVYALAQDLVPGFMLASSESSPRKGRPPSIPEKMLYDFVLLRQTGLGPAEAKKKLNLRGIWRGKIPPGINARYSELCRRGGLEELIQKFEEGDRTK